MFCCSFKLCEAFLCFVKHFVGFSEMILELPFVFFKRNIVISVAVVFYTSEPP